MATRSWRVGVDGSWSAANDWTPTGAPTSADNVVVAVAPLFSFQTTITSTIDQAYTIRSLEVDLTSSVVTQLANAPLTINTNEAHGHGIYLGGGTLRLTSSSNFINVGILIEGGTLISDTTGALSVNPISFLGSGTLLLAGSQTVSNSIDTSSTSAKSVIAASHGTSSTINGAITTPTAGTQIQFGSSTADGEITLGSGFNNFTGAKVEVAGGKLHASGFLISLTNSFLVDAGATLDISASSPGNTQLNGLTNNGTIVAQNTDTKLLMVAAPGGSISTGTLADGTGKLSLEVISGTFNVSGSNSYTGTTNIDSGGIIDAKANAFQSSSKITIASTATYGVSATSTIQAISNSGLVTLGYDIGTTPNLTILKQNADLGGNWRFAQGTQLIVDLVPSLKSFSMANANITSADTSASVTIDASGTNGIVINGSSISDTIIGSPGADTFFAGSGTNKINGGGGFDNVIFTGPISQYTFAKSGSTFTVADTVTTRDGVNQLTNVSQAKFSDITLVYDLQSAEDLLVYKLYQATYARTPDNAGFRFWANAGDATNLSAISLADAFLAAPEFSLKYGTNPTNTAFVTALYTNVLGRAPDPAGLAFWISTANSGTARDALLVSFALSAENANLIGSHVQNGFWTT